MSSLRQAAEHANIMMLSRSNEELSSPSVCIGNLIMPIIQDSKMRTTSPVGFRTELCMGLNGRGKLNVVGLYGELKRQFFGFRQISKNQFEQRHFHDVGTRPY